MKRTNPELGKSIADAEQPMTKPQGGINTEAMIRAWKATTDTLREVIAVVQRNEEKNQETMRDNAVTRRVVTVNARTAFVVIAIAAGIATLVAGWFVRRMAHIEGIAWAAKASLDTNREETTANSAMLRDALELLRRQSKMQALKVETDTAGAVSHESGKQVIAESIQIQARAIEAERNAAKLTRDRPTNGELDREMARVKKRAAELHVQLEPKSD